MAKKNYKVVNRKKNIYYVRGTSTIIHRIRIKFELSCDEYVFMNFLKDMQDGTKDRIKYSILFNKTGIPPQDVPALWKSLKEKELVYLHPTGIVTTSQEWDDAFNTGGDFDSFWKIKPVGNKQSAKKMYLKTLALGDITHDELCEKYNLYIDYCAKTDVYMKNTSSWLNPTYKYWEDDLIVQKKKSYNDPPDLNKTTLDDEF